MADQNDKKYENNSTIDIAADQNAMGFLKDLQRITEIANEENGRKAAKSDAQNVKAPETSSKKEKVKAPETSSKKEEVKARSTASKKEETRKKTQTSKREEAGSRKSAVKKEDTGVKKTAVKKEDTGVKKTAVKREDTGVKKTAVKKEDTVVKKDAVKKEDTGVRKTAAKKEETKPEKQVPGKNKTKTRKKHPVLTAIFILLAAAVIAALVVVYGFTLKNVVIEGNERVSEEEINALIGKDDCYDNTLLLWLKNRKIDISGNAVLSRVSLDITDMNTVTVQVKEQTLTGCIQQGTACIYFNHKGVEIFQDTENSENLPVVTGLEITSANAGEYITTSDDAAFKTVLNIADYIGSYNLAVEKINVSTDGTYTLTYKNVTIALGSSADMEDKISGLADLFSKLGSLSGTLHLENYNSSRDTITFTKD